MENTLELYLHIPFCVKKCAYCDFLSFSSDEQTQKAYVDALLREIAYYGEAMRGQLVTSVYIGGGTPTWLNQDLMLSIIEAIKSNFTLWDDVEFSMECNPGTATLSKLQAYKLAGVNRLSIGLQSADNEELALLGRIHTYEQFLKTYEMARNAGFGNLNVDLISGLPHQTTAKFVQSLQQVIRLKPEHLSCYTLIVEPGTPFYDRYKDDVLRQEAGKKTLELPDEDVAYEIYKTTQHMLTQAGYVQYEISNYSKAGYECEHNIGYWKRKNYLGMGLGAASLLDNIRFTNTSDLYGYIEGTKQIEPVAFETTYATNLHQEAEVVSRKSQMEEFIFLGLRMKEGISRTEFETTFGVTLESVYKEVMDSLKEQDLLALNGGRMYLTDRGMDLANYVMAQFV